MIDAWTRKRFPRFTAGEVVALTKDAIRKNIKGRGSIYGVVIGKRWIGRLSVKVRRVDQRTASDYAVWFWRHTTPVERRRARVR